MYSDFSKEKTLHQIDFKTPRNLKDDKEILIGDAARQFINNKENHLRQHRIAEFFTCVKKYYQVLCDYLLLKLPLRDPVLMHAAVVNTDSPGAKASLDYFLQR
jgi:hypothetical protein